MKKENVRSAILRNVKNIRSKSWEIARLLCLIVDGEMYKDWGYSTLTEYVEVELDFKMRQAQNLRRAWCWHQMLPEEGQRWARSISINLLRRFISEIDADNWEEWRDRLQCVTTRMADEMKRGIIRERVDLARETRVRRVAKETLGMPLVNRMCAMRTMGLSAEEVARSLGVEEESVRSSMRLIQVFVPLDVYECIRDQDTVRHVESELLQIILEWHATPLQLATGTDDRKAQ